MPSLVLFHKGQPLLRERLSDSLTLGSDLDNEISLFDGVLPHHARLEVAEGRILLVELEGPTYLNGERVIGSAVLKTGDLFDCGAYRFQIIEGRDPVRPGRDPTRTATVGLREGKGRGGPIPIFRVVTPVKKGFRRAWILIGRSPASDLVLDNPFVSSQHAEIFLQDGRYLLRDLHSRNGTYLNEMRVTEKTLPPAGSIRLGRSVVSYQIDSLTDMAEAAIDGIDLAPLRPGDRARRIIGKSAPFRALIAQLKKIAPSDDSVLLLGETGVGKDLFAQYLHQGNARRARGPFVAVNCASVSPTLAESQLFGHVRGAFTGALTDHRGFFQQADGGTLFLDEVGELPAESQARLLRVIEDGLVRPVGSGRDLRVAVRLVFATNRDLEMARHDGKFREDLYQRFDWTLKVPSLRDREEDIPLLVRYFVSEHAPFPMEVDADAIGHLRSMTWEGNVRALNRAVRRAITNAAARGSHRLQSEDFDGPSFKASELSPTERLKIKRIALRRTLKQFKGNISRTARQLEVSRVTLHSWIREDRIDVESLKD